MLHFPAVLIGGPPDSGKSVLTFHLTQTLRQHGTPHYVLKANPDGEGDWTHLADQELVRTILVPRAWTPAFVERICQDIQRRHSPLIVDVGGRPQPWQEAIFDQCTHAVLLTRDGASHATWLDLAQHHNLLLLADLYSDLRGQDRLVETQPALRGVVSGLEWGRPVSSPVLDALVNRLSDLFACEPQELRRRHLASAPVEMTLDLDRLARTLNVPCRGEQPDWAPHHLPGALDYLPEATALGVYGRGPVWLYAALVLYAYPEPFYQFDIRLGWVKPPQLIIGESARADLQVRLDQRSDHVRIEAGLCEAHLDYTQVEGLGVPPVPSDSGIVISGRLPMWLWTAIALAYRSLPWLAIYQPQLQDKAVVIHSRVAQLSVGQLVHSPVAPEA